MKYFVYAKIGKYLYRQRVLPENFERWIEFLLVFLSNSQEKICKNRVKFRFCFCNISFKRRYHAHQTKN